MTDFDKKDNRNSNDESKNIKGKLGYFFQKFKLKSIDAIEEVKSNEKLEEIKVKASEKLNEVKSGEFAKSLNKKATDVLEEVISSEKLKVIKTKTTDKLKKINSDGFLEGSNFKLKIFGLLSKKSLLLVFVSIVLLAFIFLSSKEETLEFIDNPTALNEILEIAIGLDKLIEDPSGFFKTDDGVPYTGWAKTLYESGDIKYLNQLSNGKHSGVYAKWHTNGIKAESGFLKNGEPSGFWTYWYKNGQKSAQAMMVGKKMPSGKATKWYENGNMESEGFYKNGKLEGKATKWYENGNMEAEGFYKNGKKEGIHTKFSSNGKEGGIHNTTTYQNGTMHGSHTTWWNYPEQKLKQGSYKLGKKDGLWNEWFDDGRVDKKEMYRMGELVSENPSENTYKNYMNSKLSLPVKSYEYSGKVYKTRGVETVKEFEDIIVKILFYKKWRVFSAKGSVQTNRRTSFSSNDLQGANFIFGPGGLMTEGRPGVNAYLNGNWSFRIFEISELPPNGVANYILKSSLEGKDEILILHDRHIELSWGDAMLKLRPN